MAATSHGPRATAKDPQPPRMASGGPSTALGILSILFWGTTVGFSRPLTEELGTLTAAAGIYLIAGVIGVAVLAVRPGGLGRAIRLPARYLFGCGALFVFYTLMLYLAIGLAPGRAETVEVGLVNYLWPSCTLLLSVVLLGRRASVWLAPGMAIALGGVALGMAQGGSLSAGAMLEHVRGDWAPYACALAGAVAWGFYSNLSRRWAGRGPQSRNAAIRDPRQGGGAVPLFLLASAAVLLTMRLFVAESSHWSARTAAGLLYMGLGPALAAYVCWDRAMRSGHIILVASLAYFTPLISTIISCAYLGVAMGPKLWLACAMVVAGAILCKRSIRDPADGSGSRGRPADPDAKPEVTPSGST